MKERSRKWAAEKCEEVNSASEEEPPAPKDYSDPTAADEKLDEIKGIIRDMMDFQTFRNISNEMFTKDEEDFYVPV